MSSGIGKSIRIKGDVVAREPFLIAGRVEGTIAVDQHTLTIAPDASINAAITAESVVIEGTVERLKCEALKCIGREAPCRLAKFLASDFV